MRVTKARFTPLLARNIARLEELLRAGGHYDEIWHLRRIATLARLVSEAQNPSGRHRAVPDRGWSMGRE